MAFGAFWTCPAPFRRAPRGLRGWLWRLQLGLTRKAERTTRARTSLFLRGVSTSATARSAASTHSQALAIAVLHFVLIDTLIRGVLAPHIEETRPFLRPLQRSSPLERWSLPWKRPSSLERTTKSKPLAATLVASAWISAICVSSGLSHTPCHAPLSCRHARKLHRVFGRLVGFRGRPWAWAPLQRSFCLPGAPCVWPPDLPGQGLARLPERSLEGPALPTEVAEGETLEDLYREALGAQRPHLRACRHLRSELLTPWTPPRRT